MSDIRFEGWLHKTGTGGVYQDSAGNVGIASTQPKTRLDIGNGGFQVGPTGIATVTTINTTNIINATQLSHRNLVINGAMQVAQRGTSSTTNGYQTVDRFNMNVSGTDEAPTMAQVDVSSSDSGENPYDVGLTKAIRLTNGNQTSGAGAADRIRFYTIIEARDMRNSGWNYTSASSYVTLSFYVKSSVSQNFFLRLTSSDGTSQSYIVETGTLTANTWTKITKTIPGNSNVQFNDDSGQGLFIVFVPFRGTDNTGTRPLNAWAQFDASTMYPDMTSTWYTTNDATFEVTGLQLEVGSQATPFEHRSYGDEMARCQRYYIFNGATMGNAGKSYSMSGMDMPVTVNYGFPVQMRATPSVTTTNSTIKDDSDSNVSANISSLSIYGHQYGVKKVGGQSEEYGLTISDFKYDAEL